MKGNSEYVKLLKDPRWQKRRLEIMQRDGFACVHCGDTEETLHVHHTYYDKRLSPWEYAEHQLLTLCKTCHEYETEACYDEKKALIRYLGKAGFTSSEINTLTIGFDLCALTHIPEVLANTLRLILQDEKLQRQVIDMTLSYQK